MLFLIFTFSGPTLGLLDYNLFESRVVLRLKDLYFIAPKMGSVFIGLMTPDGAIWSRYQRTVLMR